MSELLDDEKRFYERFWSLHHDAVLFDVCKTFGIGVFRRSSVLEGFASFIQVQGFSGRRCIEIGTCKGLTALILARHFDEVVSIDVVEDAQRCEIARHCGIQNIRFVTVADNTEKARVINGLTFDAAYVDGDHIRDTVTDFALIKRGGRALFHEYWDAQPAVLALVDQLRASGLVVTQGKLALWTAG